MSKIDDGGPAFPVPHLVTVNGEVVNHGATGGMTLRDYFAAQAMQAMVSCYMLCDRGDGDGSGVDMYTPSRDLLIDRNGISGENEGANEVASDSYKIADAMLAERAKGGAA